MTIWVDADSCPVKVRQIIIKASNRTGFPAVFVANRQLPGVETEDTTAVVVDTGEGVADKYIVDNSNSGDIVITRDIPLAADLAAKDVLVLDDRGGVVDKNNARERLSMRNAMTELRSYGVHPETTRPMSNRDIQQFANVFDKQLRLWINRKENG